MADRPLWLIRAAAGLEGHGLTSIFVPTVTDVDHQPLGRTRPCRGTRIHVIEDSAGTIYHQFQRNYDCSTDTNLLVAKRLGSIAAKYVAEPFDETFFAEVEPVAKGAMDDLALRVPATRSAEGCSNQLSETWIREYIAYLVERRIVEAEALDVLEKAMRLEKPNAACT
ncbi:hypothetical protein BDY17DRAFT_323133 [Neohortaea acidophila]|uniref:Uncharacterized protein n=1 Tax=Neohortaea acidophila TaxID=245834 RepID=A0A6A6PWY4_9PEZI|nr:uncharacterized protein BDY17DRAFT_323133 [Neohortaea acidophila]KAF2484266.1 hypothetical protein BDY17DRAFT_323133 [Neohortaea acidophila]